MTSFSFYSGVQTQVDALEDDQGGFVGVAATVTNSVTGAGSDIMLNVFGTVLGIGWGISIGGGGNSIHIGSTGIVQCNGYGLWFNVGSGQPAGQITNLGQISGEVGVVLGVLGASSRATMTNTGSISGAESGIAVGGIGTAVIANSGLIQGTTYGISNIRPTFPSENPELRLTNTGEIRGSPTGSFFAVRSGDAADRIVNRGEIFGDVGTYGAADLIDNRFGRIEGQVEAMDGNDVFDNRSGVLLYRAIMGAGDDVIDNRGGVIHGNILLDTGNDTLILGAGVEVADGGTGTRDLIDARKGPGGVIDLVSDRGTGWASGDELTGFERVQGSAAGADTIYGNAAANTLYGYGGVDSVMGDAGADALIGGRGADRLAGGTGHDSFIYRATDEGGDLITDFSNTATSNDRFQIDASAFGGGLVPGALAASQFRARSDNVAQDSDDRFIFRTTDKTLWFDANGNGAGGLILLADLQASAVVTAADIFLF